MNGESINFFLWIELILRCSWLFHASTVVDRREHWSLLAWILSLYEERGLTKHCSLEVIKETSCLLNSCCFYDLSPKTVFIKRNCLSRSFTDYLSQLKGIIVSILIKCVDLFAAHAIRSDSLSVLEISRRCYIFAGFPHSYTTKEEYWASP